MPPVSRRRKEYYALRGLSLIHLPFAEFSYSGLSVFAPAGHQLGGPA
jgi:hypothetical protein